MKKILFTLLSCAIALTACNSNDDHITPSNISDITHTARPGALLLKWDVPIDSNYLYVKVSYHDPWTDKDIVKLASVYSDTIVISEMLQKFGDYTFTLQTFSSTGDGGTPIEYKASSLPRPAEQTVSSIEDITLTADMLSTNSQETKEGPIADMIDGNNATFFHSRWSGTDRPWPAYVQVELAEPVRAFIFKYITRNNAGAHKPQEIDVQVSNDGTNFTTVTSITEGLPTTASTEYASSPIVADQAYKYIRLLVKKTNQSDMSRQWFCMAELKLQKCEMSIYDPENE